MSSTSDICRECGTRLKPAMPHGLCVSCLLSLGLKQNSSESNDATDVPSVPATSEISTDKFDRFRIIEKIGEGGCGIVYRAEQLQPIHRQVALKVIKLGMETENVITRFEAERQVLALMDHPGIAKVFDAGVSQKGRPFFAMELVAGERLTDYCDRQQLSVTQRLELFVRVCEAVQHAHQKGIIHRDLKPSNILVTERDRVAQPKVIDFGIAKATSRQRLANHTIYTAFDQFVGTPAYMSPEQAGATGEDVDTRSDIYSLGVLLYELLTGRPPFSPERLRHAAVDEVFRIIRDEDPHRPSASLTTLSASELLEASRSRLTAPQKLVREVRGDLDWVVMKALEKLPSRRYATAGELTDEIRRHLNHEPVRASPPNAIYLLRKTMRRNKLTFTASAAVLLALILGVVISTWQYLREGEARRAAIASEQNARTQAARAEHVARFLKQTLASAGPSVALGRDTKLLREILDATAARIGHELKDYPDVEAELRLTISRAYQDIGELRSAEQMSREALRLREELSGSTNIAVTEALHSLIAVLNVRASSADLREAESLARRTLALQKARWGDEHEEVSRALLDLAWNLSAQRRFVEAEGAYRQVLAFQRKHYPAEDERLIPTLTALGALLSHTPPKLEEAETLARESLALQERKVGHDHPSLADGYQSLSMILQSRGKSAEAETNIRRTLNLRRKYFGEDSPLLPTQLSHLAITLSAQGKLAEAETTIREAIAHQNRFFGNDHPHLATYLMGPLVSVLKEQEKWPEAETNARDWVALCRAPNSSGENLFHALNWQALIFMGQKKWSEAELVLRELTVLYPSLPASVQTIISADTHTHVRRALGETLLRQAKFTEAEPLLLSCHEALRNSTGRWNVVNSELSLRQLAELCEATGRPAEAAVWKERLALFQTSQALTNSPALLK